MIADFMRNFCDDKSQKLKELKEEFEKIVKEQATKEADKKDTEKSDEVGQERPLEKRVSTKRVQPLTRLRKNIEEVKQIQKKPDQQFVIDRIGDIFK